MRKNASVVATALLSASLLMQGCSTLSAGRKYTLAKVDRDWKLVEPHRLLEQKPDDLLDDINPTGNWGLTMNGGFLPYLEAIERPEVVIFVSVRIRESDAAEHSLLWEHVYLNSEEKSEHIALNKNSFLPRDDIQLLPPIVYEGQDIFVQIRVIELDQEDNRRTLQLVNTAASAASAFEPDLGITASVFQTALTYLVANNADDIEFQYDFALSETPGPIRYGGVQYDNVLNPRVGKYVVIKTEHRERTKAPNGTLDAVGSGLRYGAAEILKFGTLGIFNWIGGWFYSSDQNLDDGQWDFYQWMFQYPFRIARDSWVAPEWREGALSCGDASSDHQLYVRGNRLVVDDADGSGHLFENQGYLVFSVVAAKNGVDVKSLSDLAKQKRIVDNLAIDTSQLSVEDSGQHLDLMTKALQNYASERATRKEFLASLAEASGDEAIAAVKAEYKEKVEQLEGKNDVQRAELLRFIDKRAQLRRETAAEASLSPQGLQRLGRMGGRMQSERYVSGGTAAVAGKPAVRIGYLLDDHDAVDGSNLEFRLRPTQLRDVGKLHVLKPPVPRENPFGRFLELELVGGTGAGEFATGAHELLVLGLGEGDVRSARMPIWITPDPELDDVQMETDTGRSSFDKGAWAKGKRAFLQGRNFDHVVAVKVTSAGVTRRLPLQRSEDQGIVGPPFVEYWIEHEVEAALRIEKLRLVMVDEHFFRDLADSDKTALPKVAATGKP